MPAWVEPQPRIVRHLARNEDEVVADDRRHKAGSWRRRNARRMDFVDLVPAVQPLLRLRERSEEGNEENASVDTELSNGACARS